MQHIFAFSLSFAAMVFLFTPDNPDKTAIADVLSRFELGIRERSHEVLMSVFLNENAALYGVRDGMHTGEFDPQRNSANGFVAYISGSAVKMEERLIEPAIEVFDGIATVVCKYEFFRDGMLSNYGIDVFSLVKTEAGWKIASIVWTVTVTEEMLKRMEADPGVLRR